MLFSAVSVLVVAQSSSEIPEGLMNNPVHCYIILLSADKHNAEREYMAGLYRLWQYINV